MSIFKMPYNYDTLMGECPDESSAAEFFSKLVCFMLNVSAIIKSNASKHGHKPWKPVAGMAMPNKTLRKEIKKTQRYTSANVGQLSL